MFGRVMLPVGRSDRSSWAYMGVCVGLAANCGVWYFWFKTLRCDMGEHAPTCFAGSEDALNGEIWSRVMPPAAKCRVRERVCAIPVHDHICRHHVSQYIAPVAHIWQLTLRFRQVCATPYVTFPILPVSRAGTWSCRAGGEVRPRVLIMHEKSHQEEMKRHGR